ncbi:nitrilase-related carbon-nitrogen hydrolase [Halococcus saccharolyticus]|uniref:nitrilase-related carbon-nitrogen hydrolase n=1 Tax=Halococcus saccharolyticus TaxID=62319 RepID=UPI000677764F|nr:nitrilase-related carbon-nitrogen hydrolase [Halococcus saccharolyticus]
MARRRALDWVVSGAFVASSNRVTIEDDPSVVFGGEGWIVDPDGAVIARTTRNQPFVTIEIDLDTAERAKETYPRPAFRD